MKRARSTVARRVAAAACALAPAVQAATVYDESTSGDLSGNGLTPTFVSLAAGSNVVTGTTGRQNGVVDRDYLSFTVPAGWQLSAITPLPGTSTVAGGLAFIGIEAGAQVTTPVTGPATTLLGWHHYAPGDVGNNILPLIGAGAGAIGFSGALAAGTYSVWIQETGTGTVPYVMEFTLSAVPEPGSAWLLLTGAMALVACRRARH
jgi:hypothetical protein